MTESSPVPSLPPLPLLPHPSSLSVPGAPSAFFINEARRAYDSLDLLRQDLLRGDSNYILDPPNSSSLPPLPPVPLPPKITYRRPSVPSLSAASTSKPTLRHPPPTSSRFGRAKNRSDSIEAFNLSGVGKAELKYDGTAVFVELDGFGAAWVLLKGKERMEVENVRVFAEHETESRSIHASSSSAPYRVLSKNFTDLELSLPELLYRLTSLPDLITQPCLYCSQHLRMPDGLPYACTGWLSGNADAAANDKGAGDLLGEEGGGKWVSWHPSCEPPS